MSTPRPPRLAAALLAMVGPHGWAGESLRADLEEEFGERAVRGGARAWYWRVSVQLAAAYLWDGLRWRSARREQPSSDAQLTPHGSHLGDRASAPVVTLLLQDVRFAVRSFLRTPGFTLLAVATIAVGIGSATAVFSVADGVLLRPLPFPHADRLVHVWTTRPTEDAWREVVAGATYLDWERDARAFEGLAAYRPLDFNVSGGEFPERITGISITTAFFGVLQIRPALGRLPGPDDGIEATHNTVVLSDALWKTRYGADSSVLGKTLILDGQPHTIVAVLPPGLTYPEEAALYVPSPYRVPLMPIDDADWSADRSTGYLRVVGRLADGVSIGTAQTEMSALVAQQVETFGDPDDDPVGVSVVPAREDLVGHLRPTLVVFLGAVAVLLLIACANVANLLTVRAHRRRRELAVRISLGAGIVRIRRQLLTEAVVLALGGGLPGLVLAYWGTRALVSLAPDSIPRLSEVAVNPQVLVFSLLITLATGLVFGLAPMVGLSGKTASLALREGRGQSRSRPELLRDAVIVSETALALLLLVGAGLMVRTYQVLRTTDPGFNSSGVLVAHVSLPASSYEESADQAAFYHDALSRIRALPGVESAATILTPPMHWAIRGTLRFSIEGAAPDRPDDYVAGYQIASADYFTTLRIPLLQGRSIAESDRDDSPNVAVINEAMARRYWSGQSPLGQRITFWGDPDDPDAEWATIVGVVGNTVKGGLDQPPEPEAFMPMQQVPMSRSSFVVRATGDPYALAGAVRRCIEDVDASLPLYGLLSMDDVLASSLDQRRFRMVLLGVFAAAALLLTAVGLYGVISFSVGQRTREIGIRMALGATRDRVVGQVVRQGLVRTSLGLVLGALASLGLTRVIASQVFGVSVTDLTTYAGSACVLGAVALFACVAPAIRAARVDPAVTMRNE